MDHEWEMGSTRMPTNPLRMAEDIYINGYTCRRCGLEFNLYSAPRPGRDGRMEMERGRHTATPFLADCAAETVSTVMDS